MIRIYLAGPEVFLPDAAAVGARKKTLCATHGFEGVFPLDAELDVRAVSPREAALRIGKGNEDLIRSCRAIIANMTPFRGPSADVGTAWEMGFARALGLPVYAYSNVRAAFMPRTLAALRISLDENNAGPVRDANGMEIEPFGLADNLMLESAIAASGGALILHEAPPAERFSDLRGFEKCLKALRERFG